MSSPSELDPTLSSSAIVHVSAVEGGSPLRDGQKVSYDIGQDRKTGKSRAENVRSA